VAAVIQENERVALEWERTHSPEYLAEQSAARDREQWRVMQERADARQGRASSGWPTQDPGADPSMPSIIHRQGGR